MKGRPNGWQYRKEEETRLKSNDRKNEWKNNKYGRRREGRWTPIRVKAQDTRANPNSWETHLVRKRWDIVLLRALNPKIIHVRVYVTMLKHFQVKIALQLVVFDLIRI